MNTPLIKNFCSAGFFLIMMLFAYSCGTDKKQETSSDEFDEAASEIKEKVEAIIYEIPSPSEIPFIIQATGAEYIPQLVNDLSKYEKYTSSTKVAAMNLGVYASDIGYLVTYEKVQEALNYMDGCLDIGESLGLQSTIDVSVIEKFEANLGNRDTLAAIINDAINKSDSYLKENERNNIAALVIAGTFIEGLYIATQIVDSYPKDMLTSDERNLILTPLIRIVLEQETALGNMISLLKSIDNKGDWIEGLVNSMEELKSNYEELDIDELLDENKGNIVLSDKVLERITIQVQKIRSTVTY
ncbi:MAG: hypothetical protein PVH48_03165 [Cyclobacteriaceae bacterium]|jgi:hypothetical protein